MHDSWKKGFFVDAAVERRREWVGDGPRRVLNVSSYSKITI